MEDFPVELSVMKANYIQQPAKDQLTIFLVLSGKIQVCTSQKNYLLVADDLLVINPGIAYQVSSEVNNLFLVVDISRKQLLPYFKENWVPTFECCSSESTKQEETFQAVRETLVHLTAAYFKKGESSELEVFQYLFALLTHLVKSFKQEVVTAPQVVIDVADNRLAEMMEKIKVAYDQPLSLALLAEESQLSYYHASRLFKKQAGVTFTDYLNQVRLFHATEELLLTDHSIVKVALANGFATTKTFHQVFKQKYHQTPSAYRKNHRLNPQAEETVVQRSDQYQQLSDGEALQELAKYLVEKDIEDENTTVTELLTLDAGGKSTLAYSRNQRIVTIGPAAEGLAHGVQRELALVQEELRFDFVKFEGFCQETNFENEVHMISEYILNNQWFDFLVTIQLTPMISLTFPTEVSNTQEVQCWCDKQLKLLRHFLNRYGLLEVQKWAIEWMPLKEPQQTELFDWGYGYFYRKLKAMIPAIKFGYLAITSLDIVEIDRYQQFILQQVTRQTLPDFISFQADPYASKEAREEDALHFKDYQKDLLVAVQAVIATANQRLALHTWQPQLFLTDWNTLVGEGNTLAGTFFRSALILESIIELSQSVTGLGFWLNIKVKERQTKKREENSLSLFLYEELRRPVFFSLRFLNQMSGELVSRGEGYLLTKCRGQFQLLLYNSSYLDPSYSVDSFQVQYQAKKLTIQLNNLPNATYLIRDYRLDKDHGGIYNDWIRVGGQAEIDLELQRYLEKKIVPKFELKKEKVSTETFSLQVFLTLNACQLYLFQPIQ